MSHRLVLLLGVVALPAMVVAQAAGGPTHVELVDRAGLSTDIDLLVETTMLKVQAPQQDQAETSISPDLLEVALDPGHSWRDPGAAGGGLREHDLTLDIAVRVRARLEETGYRVRLTREDSGPVSPWLPHDPTDAIRIEQEARHLTAGPAAVYVSIHFNGHPDRSIRGTETYYNRDNQGEASRWLAEALQAETVAALHSVGYPARDRGAREDLTAGKPYGHFFSLRGPFPSALVEVLFLSNPEDAAALHREVVRDAAAEGIARAIAAYLE